MKYLVIYLLMLVSLVSCGPKVSGYDFNSIIAKDKDLVESLVIGDSVKINFCEAQGLFSENFSKESNKFEVVSMKSVFQVNDTLVYIITHPEREYDLEPIVEVYNDIWIGDLYSPIEAKISLKQAIKELKDSDLDVPETPFFVLRRPIVKPPFPEYKYYIFGSTKVGAVKVDSESGEVTYL